MESGLAGETELAALQAAWRHGVPPMASAIHARWWQFESWLRELVYVELQAQQGRAWEQHIPSKADRWASNDERHGHMDSPDATARLAYLDVRDLLDLIDRHWDVVRHGLLDDLAAWKGRVSELNKLRRGIAHCRRPNHRDLERVELLLADLEAAAARTIAAFTQTTRAFPAEASDPLVDAWHHGRHPAAERLVDHCESQYGVRFGLWYSVRPWADEVDADQPISGTAGYLWHATWTLGEGPGDPSGLWSDHYVTKHHRDVVLFRAEPTQFEFTFPAVNDPNRTADAIGNIFDAVVTHRWGPTGYNPVADRDGAQWLALHEDLDWRVHTRTRWTGTGTPESVFGIA